jgi:hypothetical protein
MVERTEGYGFFVRPRAVRHVAWLPFVHDPTTVLSAGVRVLTPFK